MKLKTVDMCLLFDFYGEMLTEKQRELFDLYYNEDMSLAEIAENVGISRQGVRDAVVRAESALLDMEDKLGFVARYGRQQTKADKLSEYISEIAAINETRFCCDDIERLAKAALAIASEITGK